MVKKIRVAINGFGRIGRLVLRAYLEAKRDDIEFVAINDLAPVDASAFLLEFDSVHGRLDAKIEAGKDFIKINGIKIPVFSEKNPLDLPWKKLNVDLVMECTGVFTDADKAKVHLEAGAKRVLVSAPSKGADATIVYGINQKVLKSTDKIISNASCTTNCLAPVAYVLNKEFGIKSGYMTTIHAYTGDQRIIDTNHKDLRRARAGALSMIPTTTGAAKAIGLVLPELAGKLDGNAIRVPVPDVSIVELVSVLKKKTDVDSVNAVMKKMAAKELKGILGYNNLPLVSVDFVHDSHSSIFDANQTKILGDVCHISAWYDNEWGFSNRMLDTAVAIGKLK